MKVRSYSELSRFDSFEDRFEYLSLLGQVGDPTFGFNRWLNQQFYRSREWRQVRDVVIVRDQACDLGVAGYEIRKDLLVHHINPIKPEDIEAGSPWILDPDNLITTSHQTHNAIHYGDASLLRRPFVERTAGDTSLW